MKPPVILALSGLMLVVAFLLGKSPQPEMWMVAFAVAVLALEWDAIRLPGLGVFRPGAGLLLAGGALPAFGVRATCLLFGLGAIGRAYRFKGQANWRRQLATELIPTSLALLILALMPHKWIVYSWLDQQPLL